MPVQEPKLRWQPVPQWLGVTPHQPHWLQHSPRGQQAPVVPSQAPPEVVVREQVGGGEGEGVGAGEEGEGVTGGLVTGGEGELVVPLMMTSALQGQHRQSLPLPRWNMCQSD